MKQAGTRKMSSYEKSKIEAIKGLINTYSSAEELGTKNPIQRNGRGIKAGFVPKNHHFGT